MNSCLTFDPDTVAQSFYFTSSALLEPSNQFKSISLELLAFESWLLSQDRLLGIRLPEHLNTLVKRFISMDETVHQHMLLGINGYDLVEHSAPDSMNGVIEMVDSRDTRQPEDEDLCIICTEPVSYFDSFHRAEDSGVVCKGCVVQLFERATMNASNHPPQCFGPAIALQEVEGFLDADLIKRYLKKCAEYEALEKVYCAVKTCSTFISANFFKGKVAYCRKCRVKTCRLCNELEHEGDCTPSEETQMTLNTGKNKGWQRCISCGMLVEKIDGCNHIRYILHNLSHTYFNVLTTLIVVIVVPSSATCVLPHGKPVGALRMMETIITMKTFKWGTGWRRLPGKAASKIRWAYKIRWIKATMVIGMQCL